MLNGEMTYNVNGHLVPVLKGNAFFINSRQLHSHYAEPQTDCEYICILLHPMLLRLNPAVEEEFVLPMLKNEGLSYMKFTEDVPWQRDIRDELLQLSICGAKKAESTASFAGALLQNLGVNLHAH